MLQQKSKYVLASSKNTLRPTYTIEMSFTKDDSDVVWFTSHDERGRPEGVQAVDGCIKKLNGATQKLDPLNSNSSIGGVNFQLVDVGGQISAFLAQKNSEGKSPRHKRVVIYYGYQSIDTPIIDDGDLGGNGYDEIYGVFRESYNWLDYQRAFTMIVTEYTVSSGVITFKASDIQRLERTQIFETKKTTLVESITAEQMLIPIAEFAQTDKFQTVEHDSSYTDRPNTSVGYVRITDEVISHSGVVVDPEFGVSLSVVERGALNTQAVGHAVDANSTDDRKTKVEEFIYLEGPALKLLYAIQTGVLYGQGGEVLPDHWHHGISPEFIRLNDYLNADPLLWEPLGNTGRKLRFEGLRGAGGDEFIRKEILSWLVGVRPVYADGALGFKKLGSVLSESDYVYELNDNNVTRFGDLRHDLPSVVNDISIDWDWSFLKEKFIQTGRVFDLTSSNKYEDGKTKKLEFKGVKSSQHTDQDMRHILNGLRNRYAGGGLIFSAEVMPRVKGLEVGDLVRVRSATVTDPLTNLELDRVFEIQQNTPNTLTGRSRLNLFASVESAGEFEEISASTVLNDEYYTARGTDIASIAQMSGNVITQDVSLVGGANLGEGVFYYDGDLVLSSSANMYISDNVMLLVRGQFTRNGDVIGSGRGFSGGLGASEFVSGGDTVNLDVEPRQSVYSLWSDARIATNETSGIEGFMGVSRPGRNALLNTPSTRDNGVLVWRSTIDKPINHLGRSYPAAPALRGRQSSAERLNLVNRDGEMDGSVLNLDLRGTSGAGGRPLMQAPDRWGSVPIVSEVEILQAGGAGGNGGAGFMVVCRGESVGAGSIIDLSGLAGERPPVFHCFKLSESADRRNRSQEDTEDLEEHDFVYNGGGGGGCPGAYYLLIDGNGSFGSSEANVLQDRGLAGSGDGVAPFRIPLGEYDDVDARNDRFDIRAENGTPITLGRELTLPVSMGASGFKIQYIPSRAGFGSGPDVVPIYQLQPLAPQIILGSGTAHLLPAKDGSVRERMRIGWWSSRESQAARYEIQAKLSAESDSAYRTIAFVDIDTLVTYLDVTSGESYRVRIRVLGNTDAVLASPWTVSAAHVAIGKEEPPAEPSQFVAGVDPEAGVFLTVTPHRDHDFSQFILSESGNEVARTSSARFDLGLLPVGSYSYSLVALDQSRNVSAAVAAELVVVGPSAPSSSLEYRGEQFVLSFSVQAYSYAIARYEIWHDGNLIATQDSSTYAEQVNWLGSRTFNIIAVDIAGNRSSAGAVEVSPSRPGVAVLSAQVIDSNILLYYSVPKGSLPISSFELRKGEDFNAPYSTELKSGSSSFTAFFELAEGSYTYWVHAIDSAGNSGWPSAVVAELNQPPDYVLRALVSERELAWPGTQVNTFEEQGNLIVPIDPNQSWIDSFTSNGYSSIQDQINSGRPYFIQPSQNTASYERVIDFGALIIGSSVTVTPTIEQLDGSMETNVQISYSADGASYIIVNEEKTYATNFRYVRIRCSFVAVGGDDLARVTDIVTRLDVKSKTDQGSGTANAGDALGTPVLFNQEFIDVDSVVVTPQGSQPIVHVYEFIDGPNPTGFNVFLFDLAGVRLTGQFSWTARGK